METLRTQDEAELESIRRIEELERADIIRPVDLFLLKVLGEQDRSIPLSDLEERFAEVPSTGEKAVPAYEWWMGVARLLKGDYIHDLGESNYITELGREFIEDHPQLFSTKDDKK